MKTEKDDPIHHMNEVYCVSTDGHVTHPGLTKREYFAGLAMQGLLASRYTPVRIHVGFRDERKVYLPEAAINNADALIKALNEETQNEI